MGLIGRNERSVVSVYTGEILSVCAAVDPAGYALEGSKVVFHLVPFLSVTGVLILSEIILTVQTGYICNLLPVQSIHLHEKNIVGPTGEIGKGEAFY